MEEIGSSVWNQRFGLALQTSILDKLVSLIPSFFTLPLPYASIRLRYKLDLITKVGLDSSLFVSVSDYIQCAICQDVLEKPTTSGCSNEHLFCNTCISQHPWYNGCPTCRGPSPSDARRESKHFARYIESLPSVDIFCSCESSPPDGLPS